MNKKPFIHKFRTKDNSYIYDVNTNQILEADDIIFDIIDYYGVLSGSEIVEKFSGKYPVNDIQERIDSIKQAQDNDGFFSTLRPSIAEHNAEAVKSRLDTQITLLILEVTEQCNLRCKYCIYSDNYHYTRGYSPRLMSFNTAKKAIDYFLAHSLNPMTDNPGISFYGGEPLLNFQLIRDCVEYANARNKGPVNFNLTTNGTLLNDGYISFFVSNNFQLMISLDIDAEAHDRNRVYIDGQGTYDTVMGNLKRIKERYPEYYVRNISFSTIVSPPYDYLKLEQYLIDNSEIDSRHNIIFTFANNQNTDYYYQFSESELKDIHGYNEISQDYVNRRVNNSYNDYSKKMRLANFLVDELRLKSVYTRPLEKLFEKIYPGGCCTPGVSRCYVTVDGSIYPCERCNSNNINYCIGDAVSGIRLDKVLKLMEHTRSMFEDNCIDCWACRLCNICYSIIDDGNKLSMKLGFCERIMRSGVEHSLTLLCHILERNPDAFTEWK